MIPRSYASDGASKWLLFVRAETNGLVFTAIVSLETDIVAQLQVDADALRKHSDELGLEMEPNAFKKLLLRALEQRSCVDIEVETDNGTVKEILLLLTYRFSASISRKGAFQLPIVVKETPKSLLELLTSVHGNPPQPMLSEQQKAKIETTKLLEAAKETKSDPNALARIDKGTEGISTASQSSQHGSTKTVNPMLLKRRHVPTGTMRRRGPKGAKLAKN